MSPEYREIQGCSLSSGYSNLQNQFEVSGSKVEYLPNIWSYGSPEYMYHIRVNTTLAEPPDSVKPL